MGSLLAFILTAMTAQGALVLKLQKPETYGQRTILKMELQNNFKNSIESARATAFLLDDQGKVVGQETRWILGGAKDRPPLSPDAKTSFNFVLQSSNTFSRTKVMVTRVVLEGGKLADLPKDVQIEAATN
jgi:hypothetical protein